MTDETYARLRGCQIRLDKLARLREETVVDMRNILRNCDHICPDGISAITYDSDGGYCNICNKIV